MGLKDALETERAKRPGYRCTVCTLLTELPAEDVKALQDALRDRDIQGSMIARALQSEGHDIKQNTVTRHRRGDCSP